MAALSRIDHANAASAGPQAEGLPTLPEKAQESRPPRDLVRGLVWFESLRRGQARRWFGDQNQPGWFFAVKAAKVSCLPYMPTHQIRSHGMFPRHVCPCEGAPSLHSDRVCPRHARSVQQGIEDLFGLP